MLSYSALLRPSTPPPGYRPLPPHKALEQGLTVHPGNEELEKALATYKNLMKRQENAVAKRSKGGTPDGKMEELVLEALKLKSNELKELEAKFMKQKKELQHVVADIRREERQGKLNQLTTKQLDEMPGETKAYRAVGKMFLAQTLEEVKETLDEETSEGEEKRTQLLRKKDYLELQLKGVNNDMQEIYKALNKTQ